MENEDEMKRAKEEGRMGEWEQAQKVGMERRKMSVGWELLSRGDGGGGKSKMREGRNEGWKDDDEIKREAYIMYFCV